MSNATIETPAEDRCPSTPDGKHMYWLASDLWSFCARLNHCLWCGKIDTESHPLIDIHSEEKR